MSSYIENKVINLNSNYATQSNGTFLSSVYFDFKGVLQDEDNIKSVSISVQNAQFPYSFYNINVYNNVLSIGLDANPPVSLTFTRGNYNANTLITEITTQLTAAGISSITLTISSITGLLTLTRSSGNFTLYASGSTCFTVLGFNPTTNYTSTTSVLIAPFPLNLLGTLKLRIASYALPINAVDSSVDGNLNILATIPINAGNFGLIMYENTNNIQNQLNIRTLDGFDMEIVDDDGNLINFNGTYWTITLLLSIEREIFQPEIKTSFADVVKQQIQAPPKDEVVNEEEVQNILEGDGGELYVEPPNLEESILPDDLELLLYSQGIR